MKQSFLTCRSAEIYCGETPVLLRGFGLALQPGLQQLVRIRRRHFGQHLRGGLGQRVRIVGHGHTYQQLLSLSLNPRLKTRCLMSLNRCRRSQEVLRH